MSKVEEERGENMDIGTSCVFQLSTMSVIYSPFNGLARELWWLGGEDYGNCENRF